MGNLERLLNVACIGGIERLLRPLELGPPDGSPLLASLPLEVRLVPRFLQ
jgi:hypothetical protein